MSSLSAVIATPLASLEKPGVPHGIAEITAAFGDITEYIKSDGTLDPRWGAEMLGVAASPFRLMLSFAPTKTITHFSCHKRLIEVFQNAFTRIQSSGMQTSITSFGGCFAFRRQRTGARLSTHSWGIAIDLNPESNAQGTDGRMDAELVKLFQDAGFEWGGNWHGKTKDPMHFQFCTGY